MKKRCSPMGMANAIGIPLLYAAVLIPVGWITISGIMKNKPQMEDDRFPLIVGIAMLGVFVLMTVAASLIYIVRLRRAFGMVELSESGVEEHSRNREDSMSWDEIGWIFVLPELAYNLHSGAMLESRICFAKQKRGLTVAERVNILTADDILSFPYSLEAEKYVRRQTDTPLDFCYMEDRRIVADIARDERVEKKAKSKNS